jgi:hypothetical protein
MSTVKANAYLDAAGGNTATINGITPIAIGSVGGSSASVALSGTSVTFTGIPAGVKKVEIAIYTASATAASSNLVRIGSGSLLTSGYNSSATFLGVGNIGVANPSSTDGFGSAASTAAVFSGVATLTLESSNRWFYHHDFSYSGNSQDMASGYISPNGALDRVALIRTAGASFAGGTAIVYWEFA